MQRMSREKPLSMWICAIRIDARSFTAKVGHGHSHESQCGWSTSLVRLSNTIFCNMKAYFNIPGILKDHYYTPTHGDEYYYGTISKIYPEQPNGFLNEPFQHEPVKLDIDLQCIIACFSGHKPERCSGDEVVSAQSDSNVYCYIQALVNISDDIEELLQIHVGAGSVYHNHRPYNFIYDRHFSTPAAQRYYWPVVKECTGFSALWEDTSPDLTLKAFAQANKHLQFWYSASKKDRAISFFPVQISRGFCRGLGWCKVSQPVRDWTTRLSIPRHLFRQTCLKVCGEGKLQPSMDKGYHVLRPHLGNILGKCVVLAVYEGPIFLVKTGAKVEMLLKIEYNSRPGDNDERNFDRGLVFLS